MINLKNLEKDIVNIAENLAKRNFILDKEYFLTLQNEIKNFNLEVELLNKERNTNRDKNRGIEIKARLEVLKEVIRMKNIEWNNETAKIPNLLHDEVPLGKGEEHNTVRKICEPYVENNYWTNIQLERKEIDTEVGTMLAGARFAVLKGNVAKTQRKLINAAMDHYEQKGYEEMYVPHIVLPEIMYGTGQYPKFKDDLFTVDNNYLIPTGEVPLTNIYNDKILKVEEINTAIKLMTRTPCFRKEVGAAGRDTKGIMRQHQFEKVEVVKICHPDIAENEFYLMLQDIEDFVLTLGIKYRIVELCTGDIGFAGHKAFDIELFFKEENRFREIASITWCGDFQARRMNTRFKEDGKTKLVHTMNGTGLAVGRILEALVQNN